MKFLLLLSADETTPRVDITEECLAWTERLGPRWITSVGLHPPYTASTVRVRDGDVLFTDGPFAETKEQMGGFSIVDVDSADEARRVAAAHPWARYGAIEVRELLG